MKKNRIILLTMLAMIITQFTIAVALPVRAAEANPNSSYYYSNGGNPYGHINFTYGCTRYAWGRAKEVTGKSLPGWGNAGTWFNSAVNAGYSVGITPKANSIVVWAGGAENYGHVAFVESVSGSTVTITEGGYHGKNNNYQGVAYWHKDSIGISNMNRKNVERPGHGLYLLGYIYLDSTQPSKLGTFSINPVTDITETNARVTARFTPHSKPASFSEVGLYIRDKDAGESFKKYKEPFKHSYNYVDMWYSFPDVIVNRKLEPGTNYEYKFYVIISGKEEQSAVSTFKTKGNKVIPIKEISIKNLPKKTVYNEGELLDVSGGEISLVYQNNTTKNINMTTSMVTGFNNRKFGKQSLTVSYESMKTNFDIYVNKFKDVRVGSTFYDVIYDLYNNDIISGYSEDNTFRTNNILTRRQAAKMIVEAANINIKNAKSNFKDVPKSNSSYEYISIAYEAGIINGFSDGTFKPNEPVTRRQIAKMVTEAFKLKKLESNIKFKDVEGIKSEEVKRYIYTLASNDVVSGYQDGTFKPNNDVTRGQFSKMVSIARSLSKK